MIHKIRRWYRDNKLKFWIVVLIVIGTFMLINYLNNYSKPEIIGNIIILNIKKTIIN